MTLSNNELKEIQKFNKKMKKITGLNGNKFANKIMNKLLKESIGKLAGGGSNNNQLASNNAPNVELVNDLNEQVMTIQNNDRNHTINNATLVQLQQAGDFTPMQILAMQGNQDAINHILLESKMKIIGNFLLKLLLAGMTLGGTYRTWYLFDNLSRVTRNTLNTITPSTPAPAPAPAPSISYRNLFGLLGTGPTPAPAPVPQLPPPPEGWARWMINWAFSGGNSIVYRVRIVLAWFAEVLNDLVGTGQLAATIAVFVLLTITSLFIIKMYENGIQLWVGFAGVDTRNAPRTLRRTNSDILRRITDTPGYQSRGRLQGRSIRTRSGLTSRQRSKSKKKKSKKKLLKDQAYGKKGQGDSTFRGFQGGKRRKSRRKRRSRRKRKGKKSRRSRRKRRKSRRKRRRRTRKGGAKFGSSCTISGTQITGKIRGKRSCALKPSKKGWPCYYIKSGIIGKMKSFMANDDSKLYDCPINPETKKYMTCSNIGTHNSPNWTCQEKATEAATTNKKYGKYEGRSAMSGKKRDAGLYITGRMG